ncbi:related to mating type 1-2 protein [Rhynchosporium agropyri]|uniref:Related to mating type 1-2 protein n=1 Tax=Rhynchosporium agropyri TaxID=914238 RepID=A0A1E1KU49_9HELO|nr:related to mating type 1-2 protein [Rhynchosporium agropyri]
MSHSPPTPNDSEILPHNLHRLMQHNNNTSYPQEQHYDDGPSVRSQYGSPMPQPDDGYYQQNPSYGYDQGMGNQYDGYNRQMYQDHYSTPATSPPTPSMGSRDMIRTRSGLGIQRGQQHLRPMPEGRSRLMKSPKPKKTKAVKAKAEKKIAKLEKPLSELTKDWDHLPIVDIGAYVNRSAEDRRKEVETGKIPGKVKRPMNSFMLYRKAYQGRTKDWCLQNNHQIVSQVCGDSWPLEPDHIKEQYSEWARLERINHQNAHPGYKFSPSKPGAAKASKRKVSEEPVTEDSDLDDFEWQNNFKRGSKKHRPSPRMMQQPVAYPTTESAYEYATRDNSMEPSQHFHPSSYQANNPGRALPIQYQNPSRGEYYQQMTHNNPGQAGVEDVVFKRANTPGPHSYLGLPGGNQFDLMGYQRYQSTPAPEYRLDPSLIGHDQQSFNSSSIYNDGLPSAYYNESSNGDHQWEAPFAAQDNDALPFIDPALSHDASQIQDPHAHMLRGNQEGWHVESLPDGEQFNNWMDEV